MSAKTVKISDSLDALIEQGAAGTGLSKKAVLEKSVRHYVPRVLAGEISVVEPQDAQTKLLLKTGSGGGK